MKLHIKLTSGLKFSTEFSGETVLECKQHLTDEHSCGSPGQQRLVYKGRILDDAKKLSDDYQIAEGSTLFLVSMKEKKTTNSTSGVATTGSSLTAPTTTTSNVTSSGATAPSSAPTTTAPDMNRLIQQMTQMQTQNPSSAASQTTNPSPTAQQQPPTADPLQGNPMLQSLMNENPDFLTNMLQSQMENNPALRQLMESNPVVREALQDPAALRQMIQSMSNPEARAQQQRHHDLALANIENMPGGFNMLRNLYETVQAPMEEAATQPDTASTNQTANSDATAGATNQAMPNPWGSRSNTNNNSTPNPFAAAGNPFGGANSFAGGNPFAAGGNPLAAMGSGQQPSREQQEAAIAMLESNPQLQQMLSASIRQNPGMIRQLLQSANPAAAGMMSNMSDEQLATMMEMATNPTAMRGLMQTQQMMQNNPNANPMNMLSLLGSGSDLFGGGTSPNMASAPNPWASNSAAPPQPPAIRYARQLEQMRNMGFDNEAAALSALERAGGNLNRAVDLLLEDTTTENNE